LTTNVLPLDEKNNKKKWRTNGVCGCNRIFFNILDTKI